MKQWWLVLGELFGLVSSYNDFDTDSEHPVVTTNKWYRWAFLKMIVPSEFPDLWVVRPANDNEPSDWWMA